ncbi:MAG: AAA family ATPase [Candidatus Vogelbacteria bacterium]|nr:AAA family ATPase [Candidatus Vogelbacteria bacterium]
MSKGKIVAVIGAPRSGKSFLVNKLAETLDFYPFLEGQGDVFPDFIENDIKNNQNSLRRILWFRNKQIDHFLEAIDLQESKSGILLDTFWIDYQMYVDVLLEGYDKSVAQEMAQIDLKSLQWPDIILYLKNNEAGTRKFIELGGRDFDTGNFYKDIIVPLQEKYERVFDLVPSTTTLITLDRSEMDFENKEDIIKLIKKMDL